MSVDVKWTGTRPTMLMVGLMSYEFRPGETKTLDVDPKLPGFEVIKPKPTKEAE